MCIYNGKEYSDGSVVCMNNMEYVCRSDKWVALGTQCNEKFKVGEDLRDKLISTIEAEDNNDWYTIKDLEGLTGATATTIVTVINSNDEFVKSTHPSIQEFIRADLISFESLRVARS